MRAAIGRVEDVDIAAESQPRQVLNPNPGICRHGPQANTTNDVALMLLR